MCCFTRYTTCDHQTNWHADVWSQYFEQVHKQIRRNVKMNKHLIEYFKDVYIGLNVYVSTKLKGYFNNWENTKRSKIILSNFVFLFLYAFVTLRKEFLHIHYIILLHTLQLYLICTNITSFLIFLNILNENVFTFAIIRGKVKWMAILAIRCQSTSKLCTRRLYWNYKQIFT